MRDLYEILGVDRSASLEDVRSAYKRACMTHHPDKGGDEDEFKLLQLAYAVLSDAGRRSHYDETGKFSNSVSNQDMQIRDELIRLFSTVVSAGNVNFTVASISQLMENMIDNQIAQLRSAIADNNAKAVSMGLFVGKIAYKGDSDGGDYLSQWLTLNIEQLNRMSDQMAERIEFMGGMKTELKNFVFSTQNEGHVPLPLFYTSASTSSGWFRG